MDENYSPILVSVLMCVYNAEAHLASAIDSILKQSHKNLQFIIIDDCSTDSSASIINEYKEKDKRIIVERNNINLGHPKSLNIGLKLCNGKYIARMDADDISLPSRLAEQIDLLERNPNIGLCGSNVEFFGSRNKVHIFKEQDEDIRIELLKGNHFAHPSVLIRSDVLAINQLSYREDYTSAEDYLLWVQMSEYTRLHNLQKVLLRYRIHDNQLSARKKQVQDRERYETLSLLYRRLGLSPSINPVEVSRILMGQVRLPDDISRATKTLNAIISKNLESQYVNQRLLVAEVDKVWNGMLKILISKRLVYSLKTLIDICGQFTAKKLTVSLSVKLKLILNFFNSRRIRLFSS